MTNQNPITPPPELVASLRNSAPHGIGDAGVSRERWLINKAYAAGADMELEACIDVFSGQEESDILSQCNGWKEFRDESEQILRTARRPKPPSLRKQAYDALDTYIYGEPDPKDKERTYNTIRRALEALDD